MAERGKKYQQVVKLIDKFKAYPPAEAIELAKQTSYSRFDGTVGLHLKMNADPKRSDQLVRGVAQLPNGLGKNIRVLVFAQGEGEKVAREAGADIVGSDEPIKQIEQGIVDFDIALATPDMMPKIAKLGKILGKKGLMPNPKAGTIVKVDDLPRAIEEAKMGRVEFRLDKTGCIHIPIGKVSFAAEKLLENLSAALEAIIKARPSGIKGQYILTAHLSATMGPAVKLDLRGALELTGVK